jgi:hypothetical protein
MKHVDERIDNGNNVVKMKEMLQGKVFSNMHSLLYESYYFFSFIGMALDAIAECAFGIRTDALRYGITQDYHFINF